MLEVYQVCYSDGIIISARFCIWCVLYSHDVRSKALLSMSVSSVGLVFILLSQFLWINNLEHGLTLSHSGPEDN